MVEHVYYVESDNINPYHNLGLQNYLLNHIPDNSLVFMLWKNNDSVLLGNQQSAYSECNLAQLEIERTYLARRESVGKAMYNDLGCLNYAFFVYLNNYDIAAQINVIYQALRQLGLPVYLNSDNEIMLDGMRITDNYYVVYQEKCMHCGSLYWDCDKSRRGRVLKDASSKHGLGNVTDFNPLINMSQINHSVLQSLADRYGPVYQLSITDSFEQQIEKHHSYGYIYQTDRPYTLIINEQFDNGHIQLYIDMLKNRIEHIDAYMDREDILFMDILHRVFEGLVIDDVSFRKRSHGIDEKYTGDLNRIYVQIKKESYRI